jgi:hypothetical protein
MRNSLSSVERVRARGNEMQPIRMLKEIAQTQSRLVELNAPGSVGVL